MKINVLIVIDSLGPGGAQRQIVEYLKFADRDAFDIKIVNLDRNYAPLADEITRLGFEIIGIDHRGFFNPKTLSELIRLFRREKPDIVHTYLFTADCYGRLAAKLVGVEHIITSIRGFDFWKRWHHIAVDRILVRFTDSITINADVLRDTLIKREKISHHKIIRIYNGMDLKRFEGLKDGRHMRAEFNIPQDSLIVGMVGRFSFEKDYETFFEAARKVSESLDNVYFVAVGEGPRRKEIQEKVAGQNNVIFTGLRRDVPDLIQMFDIGVLSSHNEGCPNVVLEYMACSKPVVASSVGACPELIVDQETGFLVPTGDVLCMADKLMALLQDKSLRERMGEKGRKRVEEHFSSRILAQNIEQLYRASSKPKLAFVLSQFPETHETFILREFLGLREKGIDFEIYSLKECGDKIIHPEARGLIKRTIYTPALCLGSLFYWLFAFPQGLLETWAYCIKTDLKNLMNFIKVNVVFLKALYCARIMKKHNVRHVHAHWATMPTTAAVAIAKLLDIPFSFTAHAWDIYLNDQDSLKEKMRDAQFVVTCTKANKDYLDHLNQGRFDGKVIVNYHGIDLRSFALRDNRGRSSNLILAIGRLVEQKGFEYLVKACGLLRRKSLHFQCIIVGDGPLRNRLEDLRDSLGLSKMITMPGTVKQDQIKKWFQEAHVFAAPSVVAKNGDRDGIPNVILEALAIGVPVVATEVSGIPEVIIDQDTGILIPQRDENALAAAIENILLEHAPVDMFRVNGRRKIEQEFDIQSNVSAFVKILAQYHLEV